MTSKVTEDSAKPSVQDLQAELLSQLEQLKRTTWYFRERMSHVAAELSREQVNFEALKKLFDEQTLQYHQLQQEHSLWKDDVERKREELQNLKQELESVTNEWRKARLAELQNKELEENNKYLERLVITVAVSIPMALLAEKQFRSRL